MQPSRAACNVRIIAVAMRENSNINNKLLCAFADKIANNDLQEDRGQRDALKILVELEESLSAPAKKHTGFFRSKKIISAIPGVYLWGGVGRGKSMLMDMFFAHSSVEKKMRWHFLEFMQHVHVRMNAARKQGVSDAVKPVAKEVAKGAKLLCLDECQIDDITDAIIVGRLFELVIKHGTVVVTTSNRPPDDLYKHGINRHLFLPFIDLIHAKFRVFEIASGLDHRQNRLSRETSYFVPANPEAARHIDEIWNRLTMSHINQQHVLVVNGREVRLRQFCNGVARVEFWDLCGQAYGPADFLAISNSVRVLIIENIPLLSRSNYNEAKRFVMLIDALYEAKVRLIASAAAEPERLYIEGTGSFEFERTASRLHEMQSGDWSE